MARREAHLPQLGVADLAQLQDGGALLHAAGDVALRHDLAQHHLDQLRGGPHLPAGAQLRDLAGADHLAVAQDRHGVPDLEDLAQAVGDVDHRDVLPLQLLDDGEQAVDLLLRQGGRGLVHDDQLRFGGDRLGDLDDLLLGHGQLGHPPAQGDARVQAAQHLVHPGHHLRVAAEEAQADLLLAQHQVLLHGELVDHVQLLEQDAHAEVHGLPRAARVVLLAAQQDGAGAAPLRPGQDLDQGGLARPVLPDDAVDRVAVDVEAHPAQRVHPGKVLRDVLDFQQLLRHARPPPTGAAAAASAAPRRPGSVPSTPSGRRT